MLNMLKFVVRLQITLRCEAGGVSQLDPLPGVFKGKCVPNMDFILKGFALYCRGCCIKKPAEIMQISLHRLLP